MTAKNIELRFLGRLALITSSLHGASTIGCSAESQEPQASEEKEPSTTGGSEGSAAGGTTPTTNVATGGVDATGGASSTGGVTSASGGAAPDGPLQLPGCPAPPYEELFLEDLDVIQIAGGSWLEGPLWIAEEGALYYSHFGSDQITSTKLFRWDSVSETAEEWSDETGGVGLARDEAGEIYVADYPGRKIAKINRLTHERTDLADVPPGPAPNDLTVRSDGNVYFSTSGGGIHRVAPDGSVSSPLGSNTNGIALSPDENTLYFTSFSGNVERVQLEADGSLGATSRLGTVSASTTLDGMTVDCAGNVYVCYIGGSGGGVHVFAPDGSTRGTIELSNAPFNIAFGGPDKTTLFLTTRDNGVQAVELNVPGFPY